MFGFPLARQIQALFPFLGLGFLLGLIYDVLRLLRLSLSRSKRMLVVFDVIFVLLCAVMTFCFCLSIYYGELHLYMLLSECLGFFIYYITFDAFFRKTADKVISFAGRLYGVFASVISLPLRFFIFILERNKKVFGLFGNKIQKKLKNLLQKMKLLLYNKTRCNRHSPRKRKRATSDEKT